MKQRPKTLVSFDMDGTLIRNTNSMELVGGLNGHAKEINDVFARIKGPEGLDWVAGDAIMAEYMRGVKISDIDGWFESHAQLIGGLEQLLTSLYQNHMEAILVTSGPKEVAECFLWRFPFQAVYGSDYEQQDGVLTGKIARHIMDFGGKYGCLETHCHLRGLEASHTIVIGDSYSDIEVFQKCPHSIALNGDERLRPFACREYRTEDIRNLLPQLLRWNEEA